MTSTERLLLHKKDGPTFDLVVPGYQGAMESHDAVERRYPGDALVEAATNPALEPPPPPSPALPAPRSPRVWDLHKHCDPVV